MVLSLLLLSLSSSSSSSSSSSPGNWLRVLYVGNTNMTGDIDGLTSLSNLERLDLHESSFSSTIPTALGELTRLTHLNLFSNDFTGTIPNELALLQNLQFADFGFNPGLTGTVPAALCTVAPLETVVVDCDNDALDVGECTCCQCAETTTNRQ
mmetsp:Transcript_16177/g.23482  ORF Transcript_16177/g.23482 Transcript_16177/m.23482 type:complete len:153 (+) Transcript_16177:304-762(+)